MNSLGIQHKIQALLAEFANKKKMYLEQPPYTKKRANLVLTSDSSIKLKQQLFSAFDHIKKLQTEIQNILMGTTTLVNYLQQKIRERDVQNDLNSIQLNQLKVSIEQQKIQKEKLISEFDKKFHSYLETLGIKQFECRQLKYQIQDLQQQMQELKSQQYQKVMETIRQEEYQKFMIKEKEQINFLRNQLSETQYFKEKYKQQKQGFKQRIQQLQQHIDVLTFKLKKIDQDNWNQQNFLNQQDQVLNNNNNSFSFKQDEIQSNFYQNCPSRYQLNNSTQMPVIRDILDLTEINSNSKPYLQVLRSKERSIYDLSQEERRSSISKSKSIRKFQLMYTKQKQNLSYNTFLNASNQNKDINVQENTISLNGEEQFSCCQFKSNNQIKTPRGVQQFSTDKNDQLFQIDLTDTDKVKSYETNKISQLRHTLNQNKIQRNLIGIDPYQAFFTLTAQCTKLNAKDFNKVITVLFDVQKQYNRVLNDKIPMNLWAKQIKHRMEILLGQQI